jgi:multicomponent Na+:H+ antiporter subunit G
MTVLAAMFALVGAVFSFLAGVGVLRMPDAMTRLHAATKVSAFGSGMALIAAALHFGDPAMAARSFIALALILLSTPVATHLLARAAWREGIPFWDRTTGTEIRPEGEHDARKEQPTDGDM